MLRLTPRVKNAIINTFGKNRLDDIEFLGALAPETVRECRLLGPRGVFELAVSLVAARHTSPDEIWPFWLKIEGPKLRIAPRWFSDDEAAKDDMVRLTLRFGKKEWYSLIRCCADMHRGGIDWDVMQAGKYSDRGLCVARARHGWVDVGPTGDPEDEPDDDDGTDQAKA